MAWTPVDGAAGIVRGWWSYSGPEFAVVFLVAETKDGVCVTISAFALKTPAELFAALDKTLAEPR